jgi:hypothetical protein
MAIDTAYAELLKDPRWQKKRLEIFERDGWACRYCGNSKQTLVVHHKDYLPNLEPWDYLDDWLITLCEECHELERGRHFIEERLLHHLRMGFNLLQLSILTGSLERVGKYANIANLSEYIIETTTPPLLEDSCHRCLETINGRNPINAKR